MKNKMKETVNRRKWAVITGLSLVLMTIIAGAIMGGIYAPIFSLDFEEFSKTPLNEITWIIGLFGWVMILILDILVSWGLYRFYYEDHKKKAALTATFRIIYSIILFVGIVKLFNSVVALSVEDLYHSLISFQSIWQFGLIVFGFHLLTLAPLVCKKRTIQVVLSALLFVAGIGYVLSNTLDLFIQDYELIRAQVEAVFIVPMVVGEFGLAIWLLVKGGRKVTSKEKQFVS